MPVQLNVPSGANVVVCQQLLCTPKEAMSALRIGKTQLYALMKAGAISAVKVGGKSRRIVWESLKAYIEMLEESGM